MYADWKEEAMAEAWRLYTPRFGASGVDLNDVETLAKRITRWDDWCREWSRMADMHERLGDDAMGAGHTVTAADAYVRAAVYYHFAQFQFHHMPEEKAEATRKKVAAYHKAAPYLSPPAAIVGIPFEGTKIPGYLRLAGREPGPCVILVPGADSVSEQVYTFENEFLRRGLSTLNIDGPGQGIYRYVMPMRVDYEKAVIAAVDYLVETGKVDSSRLGICGTSFGGYLAIRSAAFEPRLKAAVSISGRYDMSGYMKRTTLQKNNIAFLFGVNTWEEVEEINAGVTLKGLLHGVTSPILLVHGSLDSMVTLENVSRIVEEAPNATLKVHDGGNHVCNNMPYRYRPFVTDWLKDVLG